ncbi:hypothetical protein M407DRAFT_224661 [Tulasnella calospora MUT 4182]|uniref:Nucleoporin protein Ndc1-Nup n=1 Tax=Tulasnella calospora MUT 4182 TaxID=1051891 RepID=A0A0C3QRC4_9AGAM|nr:hypothetical protein M407DRAFT_224661 [Tulasnella calospora MUT 4182]
MLAFVYGLRTLVLQSWTLRWSLRLHVMFLQFIGLQDQTIQTMFIQRINREATSVAKWTGISSSLFVLLYLIFSRWFFRGLLWLYVFRPFIHNFVWSRVRVVSLGLIWKMLLLNTATSLLWLVSESLFSANATQPLSISQHASKPVNCLINGLESKSSAGYFQFFAFHELFSISQDPKAAPRRKAIFSELRGAGAGGAWGSICREILLVLGKDYQTILNRGKPAAPPKPATTAVPPPPAPPGTSIPPRTPSKLQKAQYAPLQRSPTEKIMDGLEYSVHAADAALSHIPKMIDQGKQLSRSISGRLGQSTSATPAPSTSAPSSAAPSTPFTLVQRSSALGAQALGDANARLPTQLRWLIGGVGNGVRHIYTGIGEETTDRKIDMILPNLELDVWAIKALCNFTAASFAEDPYGIVQRDIPRILEALLLLKQALEESIAEFQCDEFNERVGPLRTAIGSGLHLVISTFHDRLSAFRFPPTIAKKLQDLIDVSP